MVRSIHDANIQSSFSLRADAICRVMTGILSWAACYEWPVATTSAITIGIVCNHAYSLQITSAVCLMTAATLPSPAFANSTAMLLLIVQEAIAWAEPCLILQKTKDPDARQQLQNQLARIEQQIKEEQTRRQQQSQLKLHKVQSLPWSKCACSFTSNARVNFVELRTLFQQ